MSPEDLRAAREALGMSTTEFAEWLGLDGAHGRTAIREMESGKRSISGPIRRALTLALPPLSADGLRPCPLCAKERSPQFYDRGEHSSYWFVSCHGEEGEHQLRAVGDTEADAIANWNERPAI